MRTFDYFACGLSHQNRINRNMHMCACLFEIGLCHYFGLLHADSMSPILTNLTNYPNVRAPPIGNGALCQDTGVVCCLYSPSIVPLNTHCNYRRRRRRRCLIVIVVVVTFAYDMRFTRPPARIQTAGTPNTCSMHANMCSRIGVCRFMQNSNADICCLLFGIDAGRQNVSRERISNNTDHTRLEMSRTLAAAPVGNRTAFDIDLNRHKRIHFDAAAIKRTPPKSTHTHIFPLVYILKMICKCAKCAVDVKIFGRQGSGLDNRIVSCRGASAERGFRYIFIRCRARASVLSLLRPTKRTHTRLHAHA